jgi:hypothetical protein
MSKSNTLETQILQKLFNDTALPWDAASTLYISLHSSDPGEAGSQTTNEVAYTSYARVGIARNSGGFTVSGNQAVNAALAQFPQCTGSTATATHFGVGTAASGTGTLLYKGALTASLSISSGIQPQANASALVITED